MSVKTITTDFNTYNLTHTEIDESEDASFVLNGISYNVPGAVAKLLLNCMDEIDIYYKMFKEMKSIVGDYGSS